ncbi:MULTISPECIES: hypothetical protein [unclassified Nostoc]|uniref:hypothetical protein n=1 Tax=unclassified Nostoc TaxID=2593658 RepID=UPI0025AAC852|nr:MULTISPECIES: hypothetical protein [unclassified Nostoc]MDM9583783.1 hypothetical protein [Nostoc sp. GT001]MDZ7946961.1 hypothetical protein [Nostoc sp. EfeVER01]MDZ7993349.1 hypothetical protein [Nostoc sp. EspVER01]
MKDNLTLIAAATGGFILSVALAGILRGTPITAWQEQSSFRTTTVANLQRAELKAPRLKIGNENDSHSIK